MKHILSRLERLLPSDHPLRKVLGLPIFVLGGAEMLTVLDGTVVALALPEMQHQLHVSAAQLSWVVAAYVISFACLLLVGGRLGDAFGKKRMFMVGIAVLSLASACTAVSSSLMFILVFRVLQGVGAAIAAPTALSLVATTFEAGAPRSIAFAIYGSMMGLGSILGLTLGGVLALVQWRLVFWINVPLGLAIIIGAAVSLAETQQRRLSFDFVGAVTGTAMCVSAALAVSLLPLKMRGVSLLSAGVAVVSGIIFLFWEVRARHPLVPFGLFRHKNRVVALGATFFAGAIMTSMAIYVARWLQEIHNYTPLQSGFAVVPFAAGMGVAMVVSPILVQKIAPRWVILCSGVIMVIGFTIAGVIILRNPPYFPYLGALVVVMGFGVGLAFTPLLLATLADVDPEHVGPLSALQKVAMDLGGGLGLTIVSAAQVFRLRQLDVQTITLPVGVPLSAHQFVLGKSFQFALYTIAAYAIITGFFVIFMTLTPQQVTAGMRAKEAADRGFVDV